MQRSTIQMCISLPPRLYREAMKIAKKEARTKSELVREALRKYLEEKTFSRARRELETKAEKLGIRTEADVERIIDELRT